MSVRFSSGGLSFSVLPSAKNGSEHYLAYRAGMSPGESVRTIFDKVTELKGDFGAVQVMLDTTDTVFVPAKVLETTAPESFLYEGGIFPGPDKTTVVSSAVDNLCAIMSFDRETVEYVAERFGDNIIWFSPLQENLEVRERINLQEGGYLVNLTEKNIYVTSFNGNRQMLIAEVYPYSTTADIVYYLYKLTEYAHSGKERIFLYGTRAPQHIKVVKKYFSRTVCV